MHERSWTPILAPALLVALTASPSFAYMFCDASFYGNPMPSDCSKLLFGNGNPAKGTRGLERLDGGRAHLFYTENLSQRPSGVTLLEWENQVHLAKTLSLDSCSILLALGFDANGRMFQYDTGTYHAIARQASGVLNHCAHYPEAGDSISTMQGGQGWTGDKGQILTLLYSNTSAFADTLADTGMANFLPELKAISARNPSTIPDPNPTCGKSTYCSRASDCKGAVGCICIAEQWHGEFFSSKCKWPYPGFRRGVLEIDSANATESDPALNSTLTEEAKIDLACPCNCTYVSKACCNSTSGIIHEAPELRLGSVQAPSANLTCNSMTGDFQASNATLDVALTPRELVSERREANTLGSLTDLIGVQEGYR